MTDPIAVVDVETISLEPDGDVIWEVGLIVDNVEYRWFLPVDLAHADTVALNIGGYHQRHPHGHSYPKPQAPDYHAVTSPPYFARDFARLTWGRHLVGAVISFDEERLRNLLRRHGQAPGWHYHLVEVENLAVGYLAAQGTVIHPPWKSDQLTEALGIKVDDCEKHTALGDCRWAKKIYEKVMGE